MTRLSLLLALLCLAPASAEAQLLSRASSAVRGGDSSSDDSSSNGDWDDDDDWQQDDDDWDDGDDGGLLSRASSTVRGSGSTRRARRGGGAGWGGRARRGGRGPRLSLGESVFAPCPYDGGADGYLISSVSDEGVRRPARFAVRMAAEGGYALGGAFRGGLALRLSIPVLFDLRVRYSAFLEPLRGGVAGALLGRIGAEVRVLESSDVILRLGGAGLHFHDAEGGVGGIEASLSLDWFVVDPLVVSLEGGVGVVGEAISLSARGTLGVMLDAVEIYAGYHYEGLVVGEEHVDLGGPVLGVRGWL